jgi:cysteine desulfurase/selenocysteine lyase
VGLERIHAHETGLLDYATDQVNRLPGVRIIGTAEKKAAVLSFVVDGVHPHDVGTLLNEDGIAVRTGHHCTQPVMQRFGIPATSRASFAFYNTYAEIDALVAGIRRVQKVFR